MTLHDSPVLREATLPDGRMLTVRVGLLPDPYVAAEEIDTVVLELFEDDEPVGSVETTLSADDGDQAVALAERVREGLQSGTLEPSAEGLERDAL